MIIECPECSTRRCSAESPRDGREYRCGTCGTLFIFRRTVEVPPVEGRGNRIISALKRIMPSVVLYAVVSTLLVSAVGGSVAAVRPEHALAMPFKGVAITLTEASSGAMSLIGNIREIVSAYERNIVSEALQSMRTIESLGEIPQVSMPTNDMAFFPSPEYSLFPDYLDKRFSQFRYSVDGRGIVSVDTTGATTDAMLKKIEVLAGRLARVD
jgi:predicted Zn finger-like uncharacterized protein